MVDLVHEACASQGPVDRSLLFSLLIGIVTVTINSLQIWYMRNITEIDDAFKPLIYSIAAADLASGIAFVLSYIASVLGRYVANIFICKAMIGSGIFLVGACMTTSGLILTAFTIIKTIGVRLNKHYSKSTLHKLCVGIWTVSFIVYVLLAVFIVLVPGMRSYVKLFSIVLGFPPFFIIIICYFITFITLHRSEAEVRENRFTGPPGSENHQNNSLEKKFKRVATLHIISLVVTLVPQITFDTVLYVMDMREENSQILSILGIVFWFLANCNSVVDPIMFFVVFRSKLPCSRLNRRV